MYYGANGLDECVVKKNFCGKCCRFNIGLNHRKVYEKCNSKCELNIKSKPSNQTNAPNIDKNRKNSRVRRNRRRVRKIRRKSNGKNNKNKSKKGNKANNINTVNKNMPGKKKTKGIRIIY